MKTILTCITAAAITAALIAPLHAQEPARQTSNTVLPTAPSVSTRPTSQQTEAEGLFDKGRDALFRGDYPVAIDLLGKAAALDPAKSGYRVDLAHWIPRCLASVVSSVASRRDE